MDTHAAQRMLTAGGAAEALAPAVVDVAQNAAANHDREFATRDDLDRLKKVQCADLSPLEARLTWRFPGAMLIVNYFRKDGLRQLHKIKGDYIGYLTGCSEIQLVRNQ